MFIYLKYKYVYMALAGQGLPVKTITFCDN